MNDCLGCSADLSAFNKNRRFCPECYKARRKAYCSEWKRNNWNTKSGYADAMNAKRREHYTTFREKNLLAKAKQRADRFGLDFTIDESDIIIPDVCPVLKERLVTNTRYAPSLDRIDSTKGYIKGNVQVISRRANTMKNDANEKDLKMFSNWAREVYGE